MSTMADPHRSNLTTRTAQSAFPPPDLTPDLALPGDHPLLELPFSAEIDGRQFLGQSISLMRAKLGGLADPHIVGEQRLLRVIFPFEGFNLTLPIPALVTDIDPGKGTIAVDFIDPSGSHLPQLRHVLNSYIAGDVISLGRVLGVALQPMQVAGAKGHAAATGGTGLGRRLVNGTLMLLATALLVGGGAWLLRERLFTLAIPAPAQALAAGPQLNAISAGQIDYIDPSAQMGEVAFSIRSTTGQTLAVAMPCDCNARSVGPQLGATVQEGQPVFQLSEADAPVVLKANIASDQLYALAQAREITAQFPDGTRIATHADAASLAAAAALGANRQVSVDLVPQTPLPADREGQLAQLTIHRATPLDSLVDQFTRKSVSEE
ncbi:hypothetical protein RPE78_12905 [Thioclava litoralis]|uniref:HlyD family secretion protein n=1 Tax=Thioclava litoralis TaxID=3076557 RepID=A0ABZ1DZL6_9RHOB|nr:hypothetical protein RPE78_12905 [Thioclava sp. FTW29]